VATYRPPGNRADDILEALREALPERAQERSPEKSRRALARGRTVAKALPHPRRRDAGGAGTKDGRAPPAYAVAAHLQRYGMDEHLEEMAGRENGGANR